MERRRQYRVSPGKAEDVQVSISACGHDLGTTHLVDLSSDGAGIELLIQSGGPSGHSSLEVGDEAELYFAFATQRITMRITATVVRHHVTEGSHHYGFRFTDRQRLERQLLSGLNRIFNRRGAYRVRPDPDSPPEVTLEGDAGKDPVQAELVDISAEGLGLRVPQEVDSTRTAVDRVQLTITLPTSKKPLLLEGIICSRRLVEPGIIQYGIEFDPERFKSAERQRDAIIRYVMMRQREECRVWKVLA